VVLGSFIPDGYAAFARILHPALRGEGNVGTIRWSTLAELNGRVIGPESGFGEVSGLEPGSPERMDSDPSTELPQEQAVALAGVLGAFTETQGRCWFCIWDGYAIWGDHLELDWDPPGESDAQREGRNRAAREEADRQHRLLAPIPRVHTQHRDYFHFAGSLSAAPAFMFEYGWYQSPNLWWPEDRAWCVATELDGYSTYVGGTRECIQAVLAAPDLEAIQVTADTKMDPGPYG
jgi:hypothetical protein